MNPLYAYEMLRTKFPKLFTFLLQCKHSSADLISILQKKTSTIQITHKWYGSELIHKQATYYVGNNNTFTERTDIKVWE